MFFDSFGGDIAVYSSLRVALLFSTDDTEMFTEFLFYFQFLRFVVCRVLLYPLRLKLLYEAKAKGLQAALLGEPKGSFVATDAHSASALQPTLSYRVGPLI